MSTEDLTGQLERIKYFFHSGTTLPYVFRKKQLKALKAAILKYEDEIHKALHIDLKKSPEEAYASETGLVIAEINYMLRHLRKWMRPTAVSTDFLNFPSDCKVYHDPLGVVLIIAPFNYPMQLLLKPLAGAIAGGNCAVLKPSELTTATTEVLKKIINECFSPEYILLVEGDGAEVVPAMLSAFRFDHIFYTGSTTVGKILYKQAAEKLVPVTLELGGKSPCIVDADADIAVAAKRVAVGKFTNTGQTCIAPDYLLVHSSIKEAFIKQLIVSIEKFYSVNPAGSYEYGRIINERQYDRLEKLLGEGRIVYGGHHDRAQLFISPTIVDNVTEENELMKQEIFGPILPVLTFDHTREAIEIVERHPGPLSFYLFTKNKQIEKEWISRIQFGGGCINNTVWHFTNPNLPFGGVGKSGMGSYHGRYSFSVFTRTKSVMKTPTWFDPSVKYPPLKGKLGLFRWFFK